MLVGMYARDRLSVYAFYLRSSSCGGVILCSYCLPISVISLLKSPHSMCVWLGCVSISPLMVCCIAGINLISSV